MQIVFIDKNRGFIDKIKEVFHQVPNLSALVADIESIGIGGTAFVSPANSFCLMTGLICWVTFLATAGCFLHGGFE